MAEHHKKRLKIAVVGPYPLDPSKVTGGIEAVNCNLIQGLKNFDDLDLHVITIDFAHDIPLAQEEKVTKHVLKASKGLGQITFYHRERKWIAKKIAELKPDVVHVHGTDMFAYASRNLPYPTVVTVHGVMTNEANIINHDAPLASRLIQRIKGWVNARFEVATLQSAKHVIIISPYVENMIRAYTNPQAEMYFIDNPITDDFFNLTSNEVGTRLLFAGMIRPRKGVHHLLTAINIAKQKIPNIEMRIAGKVLDPAYKEQLLDFISNNQLDKHVQFLGLISEEDLYKEFEACSAVVLPSEEESSPMLVQQAMAVGKPVIATRVGGIPFMIEENISGHLVDYGDAEGLAEKISALMLDSTKRLQMGKQSGIEGAKRFKLSAIAEKTRNLFHQLADTSS